MTEEMFDALLEIMVACIDARDRAAGLEESRRYLELQQDFIDRFIS